MRFDTALEAHIDQQYAQHVESAQRMGWEVYSRERFLSEDYLGEGLGQFGIAQEVGLRVAKEMGELVSWGVFDNCREHGLTVTGAGGWTFCFYEHRNSDQIHIEGCPTGEMESYGPYGGADKYDTLFCTKWMDYDGAAAALIAMLSRTVQGPVTREQLKGCEINK